MHPTLALMNDLASRWDIAGDRRSVFLSCYALMTENMLQAVDDGVFHDGIWVERLVRRFAEYYFAGVQAYERDHAATPAAWRAAHDATKRTETMTLQHLFLGINAHINYDLALTLVDLLEKDWPTLPQPEKRRRYEDYCRVNDVIGETIDAVQKQVVERFTPSLVIVDTLFLHGDEWLLSRLVAHWREEVWVNAESLLALPASGEKRANVVGLIEAMALERADAILLRDGVKGLRKLL